jgi:hypothetical protein
MEFFYNTVCNTTAAICIAYCIMKSFHSRLSNMCENNAFQYEVAELRVFNKSCMQRPPIRQCLLDAGAVLSIR